MFHFQLVQRHFFAFNKPEVSTLFFAFFTCLRKMPKHSSTTVLQQILGGRGGSMKKSRRNTLVSIYVLSFSTDPLTLAV